MSYLRLTPVCTVLGITLTGLLLAGAGGQSQPPVRGSNSAEMEELRKAFEEFKKEQVQRDENISRLSRTSPPVGSVTAFAGQWPPRKGDKTWWTEAEIGWLLCNGRKLDDVQGSLHKELAKQEKKIPPGDLLAELRAVLGQVTLPDYRGYFFRGVDNGAGRDPGRLLGSVQGSATKRPNTPFVTGGPSPLPSYKEPYVVHEFVFRTGQGQSASLTRVRDKNLAPWTHTVTSGGDGETRPINVAVHYIIKFK